MEILCYSETFSLSIVVQQSIIYWMLELKETKRKEYVFLAIFTYQREIALIKGQFSILPVL